MAEVGLDLRAATPRLLTAAMAGEAQLLVTMGCGENCPVVPGLRRQDWPLSDPHGQTAAMVRRIRDQVQVRVQELVASHGWARL
jgi:arsenate reductase